MSDYDLAIIGGGLSGACIARDAAGRGLRVILLEQDDLGAAASSASSRLIHGDLTVLERRSPARVRSSLLERATWLRIAPHLVRPKRFVIPAHPDERAPWLLRAGLLIYDRLAARAKLPEAAEVDLTHHEAGVPLKRPFGTAFAYSDCVADDSRLVVATAMDAAARGAEICTGARCIRADRTATWRLVVIDRGQRRVIVARALANASGAWTNAVAENVLRAPLHPAALVKHSQIIVKRLFDADVIYVLQNDDGRLIYASPYADDYTLIGSFVRNFVGDPAIVSVSLEEISYLCSAVSRYFRQQVAPADVVRPAAGVNAQPPAGAKRDGFFSLDHRRGQAPLLTLFSGDLTRARLMAELAVSQLTPFYPMSPRWTATEPLPGGDFPWQAFDAQVETTRTRWPFLTESEAHRLVSAYGTRVADVLGDAKQADDLGQRFGASLSAAEVHYMMTREWARFPDDILKRRSKVGLTMTEAERAALTNVMAKPA